MGYSQKAAILTVSGFQPYYSYSRSVNFRAYEEEKASKIEVDCILAYERRFGGAIVNPTSFNYLLENFKKKLLSYSQLDLNEKILTVQIPFAVAEDEEFFSENIYRSGQKKLFDRLTNKSEKAINRLTFENILICTSNIAEYVVLFK